MDLRKFGGLQPLLVGSNIALLIIVGFLLLRADNKEKPAAVTPDSKTGETPYQKNEVKNTIIKHTDVLRRCYNTFNLATPMVKDGAIKIDWIIDNDGDPSRVELISNELADKNPESENKPANAAAQELANCVLAEIRTWKFPPPPGDDDIYIAHKFYFGEPRSSTPEIVNTPRR